MTTKKTNTKTAAKKSSKKSSAAAPRRPTTAEQADAAARAMEAAAEAATRTLKEAEDEFSGSTRAFPGATLPPKATKKAAAPKAEKASRVTVTSVAEDLIKAGKTDEEVLAELVEQFDDFDAAKKRHYPSWYRARLVRTGAITAAFADERRHSKVSRDVPAREEA